MTASPESMITGQLAEIEWALNEECAKHEHRERAQWRWNGWLTDSGMLIRPTAATVIQLLEVVPADTLADLESARTVAVELEQQNAALTEALRDLARNSLHAGDDGSQCSVCDAERVLAACDGVPE